MLKPNLCIGNPFIQLGVTKYYFLGIKVEIKMCRNKTVFSQVDSAPEYVLWSLSCNHHVYQTFRLTVFYLCSLGSWCLPVVNGATIVLPLAYRLAALCRYFVAMHFETIFVLHHFQGRRVHSSSLSHKDASQNSQLSSTGCHQFCQIVSFMTLQLKSHTSRELKANGLGFGNDRTCWWWMCTCQS